MWKPGQPLYVDPDEREEGYPQTVRPMWELVDDLLYERADMPDAWLHDDVAYYWWPGCDEPWFPWQTVPTKESSRRTARHDSRTAITQSIH